MNLMEGGRVKKLIGNCLCVFVLSVFMGMSLNALVLADAGDEWIRKGGKAVEALAKGRPKQAVEQVIPYSNVKVTDQTNLKVRPSGLHLKQGITPVETFDTKYLDLGSTYSAKGTLDHGGMPKLSQELQATAANKYIRNTTSFSPRLAKED